MYAAAVVAKGLVPGAFLETFSGRGWSVRFPDDEATCSRLQRPRQLRKEQPFIGRCQCSIGLIFHHIPTPRQLFKSAEKKKVDTSA